MSSASDTRLKADLLRMVQSECRGRQQGLSHRQLAERLCCLPRRERRLVNELVVAGHRIATSSQWGVFWVVDAEDARLGRQELADKAFPVMERLRAYDRACAKVLVPEQGSLWDERRIRIDGDPVPFPYQTAPCPAKNLQEILDACAETDARHYQEEEIGLP